MNLEHDYKKERGGGCGTETAYTVEARFNYAQPTQIAGQIFDSRWREVRFEKSAIGIPQCAPYHQKTIEHGLLGYAAAQALRWWLHATAEATRGGLCLETRIVAHQISYSHKIETTAAHDLIGGKGRSNYMPDLFDSP